MVVAHGAAGLCDILHAALVGTLYIVAEGEEGITAQTHLRVLGNPLLLLCQREHLGLLGEELLPGAVAQYVVVLVFRDIHIDGVVAVGTADTLLERQGEHFGVLTQPPDVGLLTSQSGAVDAALLTGTDTDGLSVLHVAHGVALCIFQGDKSDDQVTTSLGRERLVLCGDILKQCGIIEPYLVATLLEADAKHLLRLYGSGPVGGVYLDDIIGTLAFVLQDFQSLWGIVGRNDTVAHLALDNQCCGLVAGIAQGNEVTIRRHTVGTTGTGVCTGYGTLVQSGDIVHEIDVLQCVAQLRAYGSAGRRHVFERGCRGQTGGLLQFLYQLPAVQCIQQIDVAWAAVNNFDG